MARQTTAKPRKGRANGHGSLERRPNGTFLARWVSNGKRYSQLVKDDNGEAVTDRRTAEQLLEVITAPYRLGSEAETAALLATKAAGKQAEVQAWRDKQPALAIGDAFDAYRKSTTRPRRAGDGALDGYEAFYTSLTDWLKRNRPDYTELRQVTQADADAYAAHFLIDHTGGTFNKHLIFLRCLWRVLAQDDKRKDDTTKPGELPKAKLTCNPWQDIQKQQHTPHRHRELTIEELVRVCGSVTGEMRVLFALGVYTGLRLGDCCLLEWGMVDLVRGFVNGKPRKTMKHGTLVHIPIHPALAGILAETPAEQRTGYVVPGMAASYKRDKSAPSKRVQAAFTACDIITTCDSDHTDGKAQVEVGFHSLRHTFVSMAGNAGASLAVVQSMVGHTSREMTQYYFHENDNALRNAVNLLPNVMQADGAQAPAADKGTDRLAEFRALVQSMTADERKQAAKILADFN